MSTELTTANLEPLTHSRISDFLNCPRRHELAYELGWEPLDTAKPLRVGSLWHYAMEGLAIVGPEKAGAFVNRLVESIPAPDDMDADEWAYEWYTIYALLVAYIRYYHDSWIHKTEPEKVFHLPLMNPASGSPSRTFTMSGKIDGVCLLPDGRRAIVEHKTNGASMDDAYWGKVRISTQPTIYKLAELATQMHVDTILWDVVRKPSIAPYQATPPESRKYTKTGVLYASQREVAETPEEFATRLIGDCAERPEFYFQRREIVRFDADIDEGRRTLWSTGQMILACRRAGTWPQNANACLSPYRCKFHGICHSGDPRPTAPPDGYKMKMRMSPELQENQDEYGILALAEAVAREGEGDGHGHGHTETTIASGAGRTDGGPAESAVTA